MGYIMPRVPELEVAEHAPRQVRHELRRRGVRVVLLGGHGHHAAALLLPDREEALEPVARLGPVGDAHRVVPVRAAAAARRGGGGRGERTRRGARRRARARVVDRRRHHLLPPVEPTRNVPPAWGMAPRSARRVRVVGASSHSHEVEPAPAVRASARLGAEHGVRREHVARRGHVRLEQSLVDPSTSARQVDRS